MANTRHRVTDQRTGITGTYTSFLTTPPSITVQSALSGPRLDCTDTVGNFKSPNAFLMIRKETWLPVYNGVKYDSLTHKPVKQLVNCPSDYQPAEPDPGAIYTNLSPTDLSNLAWMALGLTNPNVPAVSLPTFIVELKDVPSLIKDWGGNLLRKVAKGHITWRWALKPMISDISKMIGFMDSLEQRIAWLTRLRDGDGILKRRANIRSNSTSATPTTVTLKSVGALLQGRRMVNYTEKVWATTQWKLAPGASIPNPSPELVHLARKLTLGITSHEALATLWEILPWSWFADWFLGINTIINATNNTVPLVWGGICIMRTITAKATVAPITSPDSTWCFASGDHRQNQTVKFRSPASPSLPFVPSVLPLFDGGKWSILASLAALRTK